MQITKAPRSVWALADALIHLPIFRSASPIRLRRHGVGVCASFANHPHHIDRRPAWRGCSTSARFPLLPGPRNSKVSVEDINGSFVLGGHGDTMGADAAAFSTVGRYSAGPRLIKDGLGSPRKAWRSINPAQPATAVRDRRAAQTGSGLLRTRLLGRRKWPRVILRMKKRVLAGGGLCRRDPMALRIFMLGVPVVIRRGWRRAHRRN